MEVIARDRSSNANETHLPMPKLTDATWQHADSPNTFDKGFLSAAKSSRLLAQLLWQRGIQTTDAVEDFLNLDAWQPTSGLALPDAELALARITQAIDSGESILVYGDFDVDGQTGTSILMLALEALGANVSFYIPDRASEGHGMNTAALCRLVSSRKPNLVITTDTGITDFNEVSLLAGLGVDCIITDHHELPDNLPQSIANVNPKRYDDPTHPLFNLCGAGVAFKLCDVLLKNYEATLGQDFSELIEHLHGIAAIGTVVDMMPLTAENRWLVWRGCQFLSRHQHVGIQALLEAANRPTDKAITSETLGFSIGPRLNALGRLERADDGVHLLTTNDGEQAEKIANRLEALNRKRQEMGETCLLEAEKAMAAKGGLQQEKCIALCSPDWHPGIVGLTATRLKDRFNVPVFLMIEEGDTVRGSARSIPGVDMHAILTHFADEFDHFGGHAGAGGFALPAQNYPAFKEKLQEYCRNTIGNELCSPQLTIDTEVAWEQLHPGLVDMVASLAPFGMANPAPQFVTEPLIVAAVRQMGERKQHLKLLLAPSKDTASPIDAVMWNVGSEVAFKRGDRVRCVFTPEINEFNGKTSLQLMLKDVATVGDEGSRATKPSMSQPKETSAPKASLPVPTVAPTKPLTSPTDKIAGPLWLDHRQREALTPLLAQLVQPSGETSLGIFHEGIELPDIPFLEAKSIVTRRQLTASETATQPQTLVLWDLPPSSQALAQLLHGINPKTIHLVGVAWQGEGALHQPLPMLLRGWFRQLRQLAVADTTYSIPHVASCLGVTNALAQAIGLLFAQAGFLRWEEKLAETSPNTMVEVAIIENPPRVAIEEQSVYPLVATLWAEVVAFRELLLTAPLPVVEAQANAALTIYPKQHFVKAEAGNPRSNAVLAVS